MKYARVREELLDLIEEMQPGEPLPAERELAGELGISRMTLRKAVHELVESGAVVRRQGAGTFVGAPRLTQDLSGISFSEEMRRRGYRPGSRSLHSEVLRAGARISWHLAVSPQDEVLHVVRLRTADDAPMAVEELYTPTAVVPGLTGGDLENESFYTVLAQRYRLHLTEGVQSIEPTVTDEEESEALGVALHSPALLFTRTSRDPDKGVVEYVRSVYRGDRYRIVTELRSHSGAGHSGAGHSGAGHSGAGR